MTRYGLSVCGAHGGYAAAARMGLQISMHKLRRAEEGGMKR